VKLALIGFGDLGHYIQDTIEEFHPAVQRGETVYFDDNLHRAGSPRAFPFSEHASDAYKDFSFYVCLGYKHLKIKNEIVTRLLGLGRTLPNFVHPSAYVHPSVKIGPGSFVYPDCAIDRDTVIGKGTWITNSDVIPHDCKIGDACWFGASVTLSGKCSVADNTFIGSGTTVSNDVHIGANVIIGLGTAVTKNIADDQSVIGNPMRILTKRINLV
jgi:sugar O-acyltransferase (sialic acid O-acetyltransferase NeuD family)